MEKLLGVGTSKIRLGCGEWHASIGFLLVFQDLEKYFVLFDHPKFRAGALLNRLQALL